MNALTYALVLGGLMSGSTVAEVTMQEYTANFTVDVSTPVDFQMPYLGLLYGNIISGPFDFLAGLCAYVCPESFPVPARLVVDQGNVANITSQYPDSTVTSFTLKDFYYGCNGFLIDNTGGTHQRYEIPANCTIQVQGYKTVPTKDAVPTVEQSFDYFPSIRPAPNTGAPYAIMAHGFFSSEFEKLQYVTMTGHLINQTSGSVFYDTTSELLIDDLHYFTYSSGD